MARQYTELQEEMDSVLGNLKEETTVLGKIKKQLKTVSKSTPKGSKKSMLQIP